MQDSPTGTGGGAANINGVLYQVLRTLKSVASYSLSPTPSQPLLIAEPIGGDLHVQTATTRQVSQFKTRANQGTWSLAALIDDVFPDLYLAVDISRPTRYSFVTDGRLGTWARALQFFEDLSRRSPEQGHELDALDDGQQVKFSREYTATERELFIRIVERIRSRPDAGAEPIATTITKAWHLLANFRFDEGQTQEDADTEITRLLRELGVAPKDVSVTRSTLIGVLTELSAKGNMPFTPKELLEKANLTGIPLSQYERHAAASVALFLDDIQRAGYTSASRLDRGFAIPAGRRCDCFAGDSGTGKSWAMVAAVEHLAAGSPHLVVYVRATGDATRDFNEAAEKISREVLGRASAASLRALALDVVELLPPGEHPWLTICVDDVQSAHEAEGLLVTDREHDRVRVVFTAPGAVAAGLRHRDHLSVLEVGDFTTPELHQYLEKHGWEWEDVPADIRRVIHRPLLARLFVEVAGDPAWRGTTEYALYETYWQRLHTGRQSDHPQDAVVLRELALATALDEVGYPWQASVLRDAGIDDEARRRLERAGWLRREADAGASIWHDRLLNWAVAEALVANVRAKASTVSEFAAALARLASSRFGYVPMDALWLAAGDAAFSAADLVAIVLELEEAFQLTSLYQDLLPTLGARILGALIERIRRLESGDYPYATILARSLNATAPDLDHQTIQALLSDGNPRVQDVALGYLAKSPRPALLDDVWSLHVARQSLEEREWYLGYRATYAALAAGTRCDPEWLRNRVVNALPDTEPVWDLAYLIAGLANDRGQQLWSELKARLFEIVSESHARSLVRCIHSYRDLEEIERLVSWLPQQEDLAGAAAFAALVNLDPDRALAWLGTADLGELGFTRSWWLPWLLLAEPDRGHGQLRNRIAGSQNTRDQRVAAHLYTGHQDAIDGQTMEVLLQLLVGQVPAYISGADLRRPSPFDLLLRVLAKCSTLPQLRVLEGHRGDAVEDRLTELAILWIGQKFGNLHRELRHLRVVLQRIGGDGYLKFARESLQRIEANDYISSLEVAKPCVPAVVEELQAIVDRFIDSDPGSRAHHLAFYALRLLAAAGDRDRVLDAAVKRRRNIEIDVPRLLAEHSPASEERFEEIVRRIAETTGEDRASAVYALGLTGRPEAIPRLQALGRDSAPEVRTASLWALDALIDSGAPGADTVDFETDPFQQFRVLLRIGTPEALDRVEQQLLAVASPGTDLLDVGAALLNETRGPRVATWMWPHVRNRHVASWHVAWWAVLKYVPEGRVVLIEHGTGPDPEVRVDAATVLSEIEPASSMRLVQRAMRDRVTGHADLAEVLLDTNPTEASAFLRDHLVLESDEECRMTIGRAFRRMPEGILPLLPEMFSSADAAVRRAACEVTGWLREHPHQPDLAMRAVHDPSIAVQQAAITALRRQSEFTAARDLRSELLNASGMRAFTYAEALAETVDPIVLSTRADPLYIWAAVKHQPRLLRLELSEKLDKCRKAVQERAQKKTRDRREDTD